jgi:hypothetical protein
MKLHFNYKDIVRAPRIAFRFQKIWINGIGLLSGYLIFLIFTYLSLLIEGNNLSSVWKNYGLLACSYSQLQNWFSLIVFFIGAASFFAIFLLTNTAVSRAIYMELRKEFFYTWRQAYKFAFRKWISVLGAILTFLFMIAFFIVGSFVVGFIGRIPFIGELGNFLLIIPYLLAALLLLFILIVTFVGVFLVPAIIATSNEDSLGGVFQSFSISYNQPWRLIIYSALSGLLEISGIIVFAFVLKKAYLLLEGLLTIGMGNKFQEISEHGFFFFDKALPQLYSWMQYLFGSFSEQIYLGFHHIPITLSVSESIAAYIFAIFMILLGGSIISYGEAIRNGGFTILYVNLYKIHENENLLEREDEELIQEIEEKEEKEEGEEEEIE